MDQHVYGPELEAAQGEGDKLIMLCAAQGRYVVSGATAVAPASMDAAGAALVNAARVALSGAARAALFGAAGAARRRCHG